MSRNKVELIETLSTLIETQERLEGLGGGVVRFETSFLKEILAELEDKIDIFGPNGDLVCTIEGPNATHIVNAAVQEYMSTVIAHFSEDDKTP